MPTEVHLVDQRGLFEQEKDAKPCDTEELSCKAPSFCNPDGDEQERQHPDTSKLEHPSQDVQPQRKEDAGLPTSGEAALEASAPTGLIGKTETQPSNDGRSNSFIVTITQSGNETLGLDVFQDTNKRIRVRKVRKGLISQWNAANPAMQVQERDRIKAINGVSSDVEQMMAVACKENTLQFLISPQKG